MLLQFQRNTFTYLFTKWLSIGLTPDHGCLRNHDVTAFLKNVGGYIHYVNCKGVEDIFKGVILFSYPAHHTEYFDPPPPFPLPQKPKEKSDNP